MNNLRDFLPIGNTQKARESLLVFGITILVWLVAVGLDAGERLQRILTLAEPWQMDELLLTALMFIAGASWFAWRQRVRAHTTSLDHEKALTEAISIATDRQGILNASPSVIYRCNVGAGPPCPVFVSSRVRDLFGFEPEECLDPSWWPSIIHPEDKATAEASFTSLFESDHLTHEYRARHKDGSYRWILDELILNRDGNGTPSNFVGSWTDVTEQRHLLAALERSRESFEVIVERSNGGIVIVDGENRVLYQNPAAANLLAEPLRGLLGSVRAPIPAPGQRLDIHLESADGLERTVELRSTATVWHSRQARLINLRDVSQERQLEQRARKTDVIHDFRVLVGRLAHELNSVLQGVTSGIELLVPEGDTSAEMEIFEILQERVGKTAQLIRQLHMVTRLREPGDSLVELGDLLRAAAPRLADLLPSSVNLELGSILSPVHVRGDSEELELLLGLLVQNAAAAMPVGGKVAIRWGSDEKIEQVFVDVTDQGLGVPEEIRKQAIAPFVTGEDPLLRFGLGLTIASVVAESYGGRVDLEPAPESGTTVRLTLPASVPLPGGQ